MMNILTVSEWGSRPILSVKGTTTIDTMLNFDGDFNRHGHGGVTVHSH